MAHFSCSETQIKYTADGTQVLFTFPFEYMVDTDIWVGLWNEFSRRYEVVTYWPDVNVRRHPRHDQSDGTRARGHGRE